MTGVQTCALPILQDRLFRGVCFYERYPGLTLPTWGPGLVTWPSLASSTKGIQAPGISGHPKTASPERLTFLSGFIHLPLRTNFSYFFAIPAVLLRRCVLLDAIQDFMSFLNSGFSAYESSIFPGKIISAMRGNAQSHTAS